MARRKGANELNNILKKREGRQRKKWSDVSIIEVHNSEGFDECLFYEILSWLPAKSLLRFKSVCKSWCAMVQTPSFISKHLKHQYNNRMHDDCLIAIYECKVSSDTFYFEPIQILLSERYRVITYAKLGNNPLFNHDVCGPCDGLYYLWSGYVLGNDRGLFNPTLNEYKALPPIDTEKLNIPSHLALYNGETCGFGFDSVTQDYKVVVIKGFTLTDKASDDNEYDYDSLLENVPRPCVLVYSLRTNSWRYAANLPKFYDVLRHNESYVFANTSLYWLASKDEDPERLKAVIVFDLATEKCLDIQLPEHQIKNSSRRYSFHFECLMVYNGDIAYVMVDNVNKCFDVWTLKAGSWTKKLTMGLVFKIHGPLGQWRDGLLVFEGKGGTTLILCNLDTQQTWELSGLPELDSAHRQCTFICPYQESLVPLHNVTPRIYN